MFSFFAVAAPPALREPAEAWATQTLDVWYAGQKNRLPATYLNYATGGEALESMYGRDGQLDKLHKLKAKYDPENRFRWYNPLIIN